MVTLHEAPKRVESDTTPPEKFARFRRNPKSWEEVDGLNQDDFSGSQKRGDFKVQPFMFMGCKDLSTDQ